MSAPVSRVVRPGCLAVLGPVYPFRGGIAQHTTLLARALEEAGVQLSLFSFKRLYPHLLYPGQTDRDPSAEPLQVSATYSLDSINPFSWFATAQQIAGFHPERVVIPWWTPFLGPASGTVVRQLARRGVPVIYLVHNVLPHESGRLNRPLTRYALSAGHGFVVQSERERRRLQALLPDAKPVVCPHPIYDQFAGQRVAQAQARQSLGLPEHIPVALFFGFVRPYKGLEVLLESAVLLRNQGSPVHLLIAGEFWQSSEGSKSRIAELELQDCVTLLDHYIPNEQIPLLFSAADVFVAPYLGGTQSGALKLALGFGLPAVITDAIAEELPASVRDQVDVVPAGSADALASGIRRMAEVRQAASIITPSALSSGWDDLARTVMTMPV